MSVLQLVSKTKMVDYAMAEHKKLHETESVPKEMEDLKTQVYEQLESWKAAAEPLLEVIGDAEASDQIQKGSLTLEMLIETNEKITATTVDDLYRYAKLSFDCGRYGDAAECLYFFRILNKDEEKNFWALWGKLAAEILMVNWNVALEDLKLLRDLIDERIKVSHIQQLQQRTWLAHWSLFIFWNLDNGRKQMIDFLSQDKMLNTIQTTCQHLLRYLVASFVISKGDYRNARSMMKDLVRVLVTERDSYKDPVTELLVTLFDDYDFDAAEENLRKCEVLAKNDFFLSSYIEEFMKNAKSIMFAQYCKIHKSIDITSLGKALGIEDNIESDIVTLIKNAKIDAKIDSTLNQIVMQRQYPSVYQQLIDRTKTLSYRSNNLWTVVQKKQQEQQ